MISDPTVHVVGGLSDATYVFCVVVTTVAPPVVKSAPVYVFAVGAPPTWNDAVISVNPDGSIMTTPPHSESALPFSCSNAAMHCAVVDSAPDSITVQLPLPPLPPPPSPPFDDELVHPSAAANAIITPVSLIRRI